MTSVVAALVLVVEVICVIAVARRITDWLCEAEDGPLLRCTVGLLASIATVLAILQVCGMVDLLRRGPVLAAHVVAAGLVLAAVPRRPGSRSPWWRVRPSAVTGAGMFFALLAVGLGVSGRPSTEPDTVQYHAPNAGFWLQAHNLWHLPTAVPGFFTNIYPSNGELAGLWLMLPSHSDQLAYAVNVAFGVLAVLAAALIVRELGRPAWAGGLAGLAVVVTPLSFQTQVHSLMTDLAAASGILAGIALVVVAIRKPEQMRWAVLAGVALGMSVGSKDTALLPGVGVLVLLICLMPRQAKRRSVAGAASGLFSLAGFWWVRTTAATGNPFFPAGLRIGSHQILARGISPLNPYSTTLLDHLLHGRLGPLRRLEGDARMLIGPAVVLILLGVVAPIVVGATRRRWSVFLLGGLAAACLLAYVMTPYTGGGPAGLNFLIASQLRYALPGALIAAVAAAAVLPRASAAVAAVALAWAAVKDVGPSAFRTDIHPSTALVMGVVLVTAVVITGLAVASGWLTVPARRGDPAHSAGAAPSVGAVPSAGAVPSVGAARRVGAAPSAGAAPSVGAARRAGPALPIAAALAGLLVVAPAYARGSHRRSAIDSALSRSAQPHGSVMVMAATDVRALMGGSFANQIVSPIDSAHPELSPKLNASQLVSAVQRLRPSAIVVPASAGVTSIGNWAPPGYTKAGTIGGSTVYVLPPNTPPTTPPTPPTPPTTPPTPPTTPPTPPTTPPTPPTTRPKPPTTTPPAPATPPAPPPTVSPTVP